MTDNLPLSSVDVTECGNLNLPEPSGPHRAVMGLLYLFTSLRLPEDDENASKHGAVPTIYTVYIYI
jgi:hypothetical protein